MIDGAMRHGSTLDIEGNYTDTHGQSQIEFGITRLLGYLLPRRDLIAEQYDQMIKYATPIRTRTASTDAICAVHAGQRAALHPTYQR